MTAEVLMATPCTKSLGCESGGHKHGGDEGRMLCWKFATVSWSGVYRQRPSMLMLVRSAAALATMPKRNDGFYSNGRGATQTGCVQGG